MFLRFMSSASMRVALASRGTNACRMMQSSLSIHRTFSTKKLDVVELSMPKFHDGMEAGKLLCWYKKLGDAVNQGDVLADIETHLAVVEFQSPIDGYLAGVLVLPSEENLVKVGQELALITRCKEDTDGAIDAYTNGELEVEKFKIHD